MNDDDTPANPSRESQAANIFLKFLGQKVLYQIIDDDNNNKEYNDTSDGSRKKESQKNEWNYAKEQNMIYIILQIQ